MRQLGLTVLISIFGGGAAALVSHQARVARQVTEVAPAMIQPAQLLSQPLRTTAVRTAVDPWTVVDAFPETDALCGAMQLRAHPTSEDSWIVATFPGQVLQLQRTDDGLSVRTLVDIRSKEVQWLYSFAIHPRFAESKQHRKIYVFYQLHQTDQTPFRYRVSAFDLGDILDADRDSPAPPPIPPPNEQVLIEQLLETHHHVGGALEFDQDGFLLVSVGDNGEWKDNKSNSQRIDDQLLSGILRIDVDQRGGEISRPIKQRHRGVLRQHYFVPADNPFLDVPGANPEFWSIGLRSPYRMSVDALTGDVWVGEVGQDRMEQIERPRRGSNHQWSYLEGSLPFDESYLQGVPPSPLIGDPVGPFYEYEHADQDYCIVGGLVYRGDLYPELKGRYLFGDNQSGRIWSIHPEDPADKQLLLRLPSGKRHASLTNISADARGRIFLTHFASTPETASVHELRRTESSPPLPQWLSETGLFADVQAFQLAPGFVHYDVNTPLWSDGMQKNRWLRLPPGVSIDNSDADAWQFPPGTTLIKHFENPADLVDGPSHNQPRRIETRVLFVDEEGGVAGASYLWNEEQTDAELRLEREELTITHVPKAASIEGDTFQYRLPGHRDCVVCHNPSYSVLGVSQRQLNREVVDAEGAAVNQLVSWSQQGLLLHPLNDEQATALPRLAPIDSAASLEYRVRSYLHSNCSFCHYPEGTQRTQFDASIATSLNEAQIIDGKAATEYFVIDGAKPNRIVKPGLPDDSALFRRLSTFEHETAMPYLGRRTQHREAVELVRQWILSLEP
ncbi:MAG: PQQ-dependent sugar dehydrogenase [Planctomycetales bacterium]|nr:PQQ-dependent sugar dehydrogenase [Planctomycetales bacterium]